MMENKLRECPFCGGDDVSLENGIDDNLENTGDVYIFCNDCYIETGAYKEESHVIEKWNRRAGEDTTNETDR